jgi:hypothetical protein
VAAVFIAFALGTVLTLLACGALSDRAGERWVIAGDLGAGSLALAAAASADGYLAFLGAVVVAGMLSSSAVCARRGDARRVGGRGSMAAPDAVRDPRIWRLSVASSLMIIGQVGLTSLLVLYLYGERGWSAADAALALGGRTGRRRARARRRRALVRPAGRTDRALPRALAAAAGVLLLAAAALSGAPDAVAVPVLMAGGVAAMSWNGLSFTAAAEISGRRQAGTAMGIQNTTMRLVAVAVPVGLGALASSVSWQLAFLLMGAPRAGPASPKRGPERVQRRGAAPLGQPPVPESRLPRSVPGVPEDVEPPVAVAEQQQR